MTAITVGDGGDVGVDCSCHNNNNNNNNTDMSQPWSSSALRLTPIAVVGNAMLCNWTVVF